MNDPRQLDLEASSVVLCLTCGAEPRKIKPVRGPVRVVLGHWATLVPFDDQGRPQSHRMGWLCPSCVPEGV
jgi:hypothetical protein